MDVVFAAIMAASSDFPLLDSAPPPELRAGETDEWGWTKWSPVRQSTAPTALDTLYATIPGRLPALFEELLTSCRWLRVEISEIDFFANPPGPDFRGLHDEITRDPHLFPSLFSERFVEFGKAAGGSYDPVCFDLKRSRKRDCPLVRIDHESVLILRRPKVIAEVAPSFRSFVERLDQTSKG